MQATCRLELKGQLANTSYGSDFFRGAAFASAGDGIILLAVKNDASSTPRADGRLSRGLLRPGLLHPVPAGCWPTTIASTGCRWVLHDKEDRRWTLMKFCLFNVFPQVQAQGCRLASMVIDSLVVGTAWARFRLELRGILMLSLLQTSDKQRNELDTASRALQIGIA